MVDQHQIKTLLRRIIHIDMDAFYASVEQRDQPHLKGLPVVVGGNRNRGVVAAASYEARKFGIRSAMPMVTAHRKCPNLVVVKPRIDVYRAVSSQIRAIFEYYTPDIQPLALDEAYLDVTHYWRQWGSATEIAQQIRACIYNETGLTASAGISYNKFLAKLASDHHKPNGIYVIPPSQGVAFVEKLLIEQFHGVGRVTAQKMRDLGIYTGLDLRQQTQAFLVHHFGKAGLYFYEIARAEDHRPVEANRLRKSLGTEATFDQDLISWERTLQTIEPIANKLWLAYENSSFLARTVTLKVKYIDFQIMTRSRSFEHTIQERTILNETIIDLLKTLFPYRKPVRLLGVTLSKLEGNRNQNDESLDLFSFGTIKNTN